LETPRAHSDANFCSRNKNEIKKIKNERKKIFHNPDLFFGQNKIEKSAFLLELDSIADAGYGLPKGQSPPPLPCPP
jgi:hypothetical protein